MITLEQYFGGKPHTQEEEDFATVLLQRVNELCDEAQQNGNYDAPTCPNTGTQISGSYHGQGDGGFRLPTATTGRQNSSHKEAKAVDVFDPKGDLDKWLDGFEDGHNGNIKLEQYGLYREHPDSTPGWCHLTTRAPGSGHRTFIP